MATYSDRHTEQRVVTAIDLGENGWMNVSMDGSGFAFKPDPILPMLQEGDVFDLETRGVSRVTGVRLRGLWLMHKSDEDLLAEDEEFRQSFRERNQRRLEENRDRWQAREDALPEWIKVRLASFHEHGGAIFERDGWGYELNVAELAVMYRESGGEENATIREYAALHGTSGNQHDVARMLAATSEDISLAETPAALTPLGAHPLYAEER